MSWHPADLPWLPSPPADLRARLRGAEGRDPAFLEFAARHRLDLNQLHGLARPLAALRKEQPDSFVQLRVLSNGTTDLLCPAFAASALRHGLRLSVSGAAFGQVAQEALDPRSETNILRSTFVLLALDHRGVSLAAAVGDPAATEAVDRALAFLDAIRTAIRTSSGSTVIVQTIPQVPSSLFGSLDRSVPGTLPWQIDRFNAGLRQGMAGTPDLLLDVESLANQLGSSQWHDPVQFTLGKFLCSQRAVPLYADWLARLLAAARGKARKCLVLDLDNTLWGGVIGDDGLGGIVLGNGNPAGEAHLALQQAALDLRARGIVLAICSKNDDATARSVFREHPEMLLREEHIAVFQANWKDKAANLRAIAETLNVGIDSLVFVDDNPAEREQVRRELPAVAVPELPEDPAHYVDAVLAAGYFEAVAFTADDRMRAEQYQANAARTAELGAATDLESYLASLSMRAFVGSFDPVNRSRITQLINKTNQFNLTTRRYTEAEVQSLESAGAGTTLHIRLVDKFGDNGIVAIVICLPRGNDWQIDTWLMSCRVLNRRLEDFTLNCIVERARAAGVRRLFGTYRATDRNGMVRDHYRRLGFVPLDGTETESHWTLEIAGFEAVPVPITIAAPGS